jgi:hypothetical protein
MLKIFVRSWLLQKKKNLIPQVGATEYLFRDESIIM